MDSPKTFISYASEDKERFVLCFAERLLSKGIEAWVAHWEMLPGDKIVDQVFNHGLKQSDVVIVVLSKISIQKPWVQKELSTAVIKSIEDNTRLIPVRLDGCEIPEALRDLLPQDIHNLKDYDVEFDRIVSRIYGQYIKPARGIRPAYTDPDILQIDDLSRNDSLFLATACLKALAQGHPHIGPEPLVTDLKAKGMPERDMLESQEILANRSYIETERTIGNAHLEDFSITTTGFEVFAEAGGIPEYSKKIADVARTLVERVLVHGDIVSNASIESELRVPAMLIEHIFERLKERGQIKYGTSKAGRLIMEVYWVSPDLRRELEGNA